MRVLTLLLFSMLPPLAAHVTPSPSPDLRAHFVGTWRSTATSYASMFGRSGRTTATTVCAWAMAHAYLVCKQRIDGVGGTRSSLAIYTHSGTAYGFVGIDPDGTVRRPQVREGPGGSIVYLSRFTFKGKPVQIETVNRFPRADREVWYVQYSLDDGVSWKRMMDGISTRVAP